MGNIHIGEKSESWLAACGITTLAQVRELGVVHVALRVKAAGFPVSLNLVYALQGNLMQCTWREVPNDVKEQLKAEWNRAIQSRGTP
jgi:DNA transformation protein and related proteins